MASTVITAPNGGELLANLDKPLVYLNGPIQGSADWHTEAVGRLAAADIVIASPRAKAFRGDDESHRVWQSMFAERAAANGVMLFWFARETKHACSRNHAAQARFELGEWAVRSKLGAGRVVVGIEAGFSGRRALERRLTASYPHIPLCRSLQQTCAVALDLVRAAEPARSLADLFVPHFSLQ